MPRRTPFIRPSSSVRGIPTILVATPTKFINSVVAANERQAQSAQDKAKATNLQEAKEAGEQAGVEGTPQLSERRTVGAQTFNEAAKNSFNSRNRIEGRIELERLETELGDDATAYQAAAQDAIESRKEGMRAIDPVEADLLSKTLTLEAIRAADRIGSRQLIRMNRERKAEIELDVATATDAAIELGPEVANPLNNPERNAEMLAEIRIHRANVITTLSSPDYLGNTLTPAQIELAIRDFDDDVFGSAFSAMLTHLDMNARDENGQSIEDKMRDGTYRVRIGEELINPRDVLSGTAEINLLNGARVEANRQRAATSRGRQEITALQKDRVATINIQASKGIMDTDVEELQELGFSETGAANKVVELQQSMEAFTVREDVFDKPVDDLHSEMMRADEVEDADDLRRFKAEQDAISIREEALAKDPVGYIVERQGADLARFEPGSKAYYAAVDGHTRNLTGREATRFLTVAEAKQSASALQGLEAAELLDSLAGVTGVGELPDQVSQAIFSQLHSDGGFPILPYLYASAPVSPTRELVAGILNVPFKTLVDELPSGVSASDLEKQIDEELDVFNNAMPVGNWLKKGEYREAIRAATYIQAIRNGERGAAERAVDDLLNSQFDFVSSTESNRRIAIPKGAGVPPKKVRNLVQDVDLWIDAFADRFVVAPLPGVEGQDLDLNEILSEDVIRGQFIDSLKRDGHFRTSPDFRGVQLYMEDFPITIRKRVPGAGEAIPIEPLFIPFKEMEEMSRQFGIASIATRTIGIGRGRVVRLPGQRFGQETEIEAARDFLEVTEKMISSLEKDKKEPLVASRLKSLRKRRERLLETIGER